MLLSDDDTQKLHRWIEKAATPICDAEPDVSVFSSTLFFTLTIQFLGLKRRPDFVVRSTEITLMNETQRFNLLLYIKSYNYY